MLQAKAGLARTGMPWALFSLCLLINMACSQTVSNPLPELPSAEVRDKPDVPVPVLPPQVCVGLLPDESKFLPEEAEAVEDVERVELVGDIGVSDGTGMDAFGSDTPLVEDVEALLDIPEVTPQSPFLPVDGGSGSDVLAGVGADIDVSEGDVDPCVSAPATCVGAAMPEWELFDFQPRSCGYKATYGLDLYKGHVTVVALLAAW